MTVGVRYPNPRAAWMRAKYILTSFRVPSRVSAPKKTDFGALQKSYASKV